MANLFEGFVFVGFDMEIIMQGERRALYNAIRMHWLLDPSIPTEEWQVQDYRKTSLDQLFAQLQKDQIHLDRTTFLAFAESSENPEELTDDLLADRELDETSRDKIYLILFELWRRLLPEKRSLSIFCDELDHQIQLYDSNQLKDVESLTDILAELQTILDENTDRGVEAKKVFKTVESSCAHDLESFIYDFISEQLEAENYSYAKDLLEGFRNYLLGNRWFDFLHGRILMASDPEEANLALEKLLRKAATQPDLDFNLEVLAFLVQDGERHLFPLLARHTIPLLKLEEDFKELLSFSADYFHCLDKEAEENEVKKMLESRQEIAENHPLDLKDPQVVAFKKLLGKEKA